jgi:hypothetical protein
VALAAGLALADASVVVLALPPILTELDATVEGAAAVIGVYTLTLALGLPLAARMTGAAPGPRGAGAMLLFAAASAGCGLAPDLGLLVALRAVQGLAAAGVLVAAFDLLGAGEGESSGGRLWLAAGILGAAIGPAFGGAMTELLDWRAIFLVQAPLAALAGVACRAVRAPQVRPGRGGRAPLHLAALLCLGLLSAALTGVLFLLVLMLVSGWALSPLAAAAVVSVLPVAAFVGTRIPGDDARLAIAGSLLVAAGVLALAPVTVDSVAMAIAPQISAGVGMGMALPALAGGLLPERTPREAARVLAVRHLGITVALALLAPIASAQLDRAAEQVRERGTALILDARLPPGDKLNLADVATADLDAIAPRAVLRDALANARTEVSDGDRGAYDAFTRRADETLVAAIGEAFRPAFLVCGALALLAAASLVAVSWRRLGAAVPACCALGVGLVGAQVGVAAAQQPEPVVIADPCERRALPGTGGIGGLLQDTSLRLLDFAACRYGSSREKLALALVDNDEAEAYERDHGVDPGALRALVRKLDDLPRELPGDELRRALELIDGLRN